MFLNTPYWNLDLIFVDFIDSFNLKILGTIPIRKNPSVRCRLMTQLATPPAL